MKPAARVQLPEQEKQKSFPTYIESVDDSKNVLERHLVIKMLISYRWDLETEETRYDIGNPLKMHKGACGGYSVFG